MGSSLGAEKSAALKTGCSHSEWLQRRARGQRWCFRCRSWKQREIFGAASACGPCKADASTASRYGMTPADLAAFRLARGHKCEICKGEGRNIDHDHATGKVRGLLCANCNSAIGKLREDPALFAAALAYLETHRG